MSRNGSGAERRGRVGGSGEAYLFVVARPAEPQGIGLFELRVQPFLHNGNAFAALEGLAHALGGHLLFVALEAGLP